MFAGCFVLCLFSWFSLFFSTDFSYTQLGRRGVWDSSHHTSTWDRVRSGTVRGGLTLPSNARAPSSTQGSFNPPVPPSEPGSALYYHLTQHDGPGRDVCQQRPTCGEYCYAFTQQQIQKSIYLLRLEKRYTPFVNKTTAPAPGCCSVCRACRWSLTMCLWFINIYYWRPLLESDSP